MRFDRLKAKGLGPFKDEIDVDFAKLPGVLVAVCGENGAGKTTLLELLAGALFRTTPTRGTLASLATERDAYVEVHAVNGAAFTFRQTVDAVSGKGEALVLDSNGAAVLHDLKVSGFDAWAAQHLPSPDVFFASTFAAQGSGGFLDMKAGERKAVLLRVLGIERFERLADRARDELRAARASLQTTNARLADERVRAGSPDVLGAELAAARAQLESAESAATGAKARLEAAETAARGIEAAAVERRAALEKAADLRRRHSEARARATSAGERIANNRRALARATEIRAAAARADEIKARDFAIGGELRLIEGRRASAEKEGADNVRLRERLAHELLGVGAREERARVATDAVAGADAILSRVTEARATVEATEAALAECERQEESLRLLIGDASTDRIGALRDGLNDIASGAEWPMTHAETVLRDDDSAAERQASAPADLEAARLSARAARERLATARRTLSEGEKRHATLDGQREIATELGSLEADRARIRAEAEAAKLAAIAAHEQVQTLDAKRSALERERMRLEEERSTIIGLAGLLPNLAAAETRLAELEPAHAEATATAAAIAVEIEALVAPPAASDGPPIAPLRVEVDAAAKIAKNLASVVSVTEAKLSESMTSAARVGDLARSTHHLEAELADWTRLAEDLGRDGLQALEIDAAGPELTALVNDLLHTCLGPRWTVSIDTARMSADGKKQLEGLEVRVLDTERGRDANAETLSGGEKVLVGEAISLALAMLACSRAGLEGPTLVRDESGAALDVEKGRQYVAMLRRAAGLVGASRVLLVTHSSELAELADARIEVRNGAVSVPE